MEIFKKSDSLYLGWKAMEEQIQSLTLQLQQKDEMMTVMKARTRDFVNNLKEEHSVAMRQLQDELSRKDEVVMFEVNEERM